MFLVKCFVIDFFHLIYVSGGIYNRLKRGIHMENMEVFLERRHVSGIEQFEANEPGIAVLKAEFLAEANEYLYLRKGEDFGGDIIGYMATCINALADVSLIDAVKDFVVYTTAAEHVAKYYPAIKKKISQVEERFRHNPWTRKPKKLHILLWPDEQNEAARPIYEAQGYEVHFYSSELDKGQHRLYLNEKRYCLFLRTSDNRFVGFIGSDVQMNNALKTQFEAEWGKSRKP